MDIFPVTSILTFTGRFLSDTLYIKAARNNNIGEITPASPIKPMWYSAKEAKIVVMRFFWVSASGSGANVILK